MRYYSCEEAIINCDNNGGVITFDLCDIWREERDERDDNREEKKTKKSVIIMKSSARVCLFRKPESGENPVNQGSQELLSTVSGTWSSKSIKISTCMAMKDSKPALL